MPPSNQDTVTVERPTSPQMVRAELMAGLAILKNYRYGPLFTPQSLYERGGTRGTIQLPGTSGGANWSGSGADPETGYLYVPSRTTPTTGIESSAAFATPVVAFVSPGPRCVSSTPGLPEARA